MIENHSLINVILMHMKNTTECKIVISNTQPKTKKKKMSKYGHNRISAQYTETVQFTKTHRPKIQCYLLNFVQVASLKNIKGPLNAYRNDFSYDLIKNIKKQI